MNLKKAELICTGSELVSFKSNRYVPLFAARLRALGFRLFREHSVGDDLSAIADLVNCGLGKADLVITCGGLGPTFDDLTRQGIARALGLELIHSKTAERLLKAKYRLTTLPPNFQDQCLILDGAKMVKNDNGTAFGEILVRNNKMLVVLPGPEYEWTPMFDRFIAGEITKFFKVGEGTVRTMRLKIAGLWETQAEKMLKPVMRRFPDADCTILAGPGIAEFNFTVSGKTERAAAEKLSAMDAACRKVLGGSVYGTGDDTLEGAVGALLKKKRGTLALAESCTGGAVADALTNVPGSSAYFPGGVTAYSNKTKETVLGVKKSVIVKHGAVSAECAAAMAEGARHLFRSDYAAAVTGIAGPGGGTAAKPVGLVHFAVAGHGIKTRTFTRNFRHTRTHIKHCSVNFILDTLRKLIQ
jgi:nicotinamide-nucleotide amidase